MKRTPIILGVVLIAVGAAGFTLWEGRRTPVPPLVVDGPPGVLEIDEFMRQPEAHPGRVRVQGIVSAVQSEAQLVTLIDRSEFDECGVATCAPLSLPVRWTGAMPQVKEGVEVTGRVQEETGKLIFVADAMEPVSTPVGAQ